MLLWIPRSNRGMTTAIRMTAAMRVTPLEELHLQRFSSLNGFNTLSHMLNHFITKSRTTDFCGVIHQTRKIISHCLGGNSLLHALNDQVSRFMPSQLT